MKMALLVIDIQNAYLTDIPENEKKSAFLYINGAIELFRRRGLPVIRVYHHEPSLGPKPGDEAFEFPASIAVRDEDLKVIKNYPSSFRNTGLEKLLRDQDCDTLFFCGLSAVGCVLATYFGALERDFKVFMLKHALLSHNARYTAMIEEIYDAVGYKTLQFMIDNIGKQN